VTTWVVTVARSRALDARRARARRPTAQKGAEGDEGAIAPAPETDRPDLQTVASERREAVRAALARLNAEQREALELAYFEGLSHSEIADRLGLPLGTVKSRILAAMKVLRVGLVGQGGPADDPLRRERGVLGHGRLPAVISRVNDSDAAEVVRERLPPAVPLALAADAVEKLE
jgi:predicted RNA polymerase sigma factor